ncbi:18356_t:CDS:2, partial [Racocetra fulgida]
FARKPVVIYLIGAHQKNLILVNCDENTVTAGHVNKFKSVVSKYPENTLGIYVTKKVSKNSLKLANSSQDINIIVTNLIKLNNSVSSYFELKKNSSNQKICELMMMRTDELNDVKF